MSENQMYDVVIVGAGPAGLSAGLYASRDGYKTLLLEKNGLPGGQIMLTEHIENYPGYEKIGGFELVENFKTQATKFGSEIVTNQGVTAITPQSDGTFSVETNNGEKKFSARSIILTPGSDYRQLGLPGEDQMRQAGRVSYCATCDGAFYRDKEVLTIGGGNTAVEDTIYLASRFTKKTTLIHRRREFRAQKVLVDELNAAAAEHNIDIKLPYVPVEIVAAENGADIDYVKIRNVETDAVEQLKVDGVFVFAGMIPNTKWLTGFIECDEGGYIPADPGSMKTVVPGVFVAGDCRKNAAMQLATACSDGVVAAMGLREFFRDLTSWNVSTCENGGVKGY
ncbi:MAG: FAD-dependent oxidoreductase [Phycisphaerae bacterium]|nr:FAD-dependent oxidoreductase [Phycisphaerae bacterium]